MIQNTGLFRGGLLSHVQVPHTHKNNVKGDKSHMQIKLLTKLFYYLIACLIKIFDYSHVTIAQP